jgi:hypothetical protein
VGLDDEDDVYDAGSIIDGVSDDVVGGVVDTVNVGLVAVNAVDASLSAVDVSLSAVDSRSSAVDASLGTVSVSLAAVSVNLSAVSAKLFVAGVEFAAVTVFTGVDAVLSILAIFLDGLFSPLLLSPPSLLLLSPPSLLLLSPSDCAITKLLTAPALIMQKMEMIKTLRTIFTLSMFL